MTLMPAKGGMHLSGAHVRIALSTQQGAEAAEAEAALATLNARELASFEGGAGEGADSDAPGSTPGSSEEDTPVRYFTSCSPERCTVFWCQVSAPQGACFAANHGVPSHTWRHQELSAPVCKLQQP